MKATLVQNHRIQNRILANAALVLVAGGIAAAVAFAGSSSGKPLANPHPGKPTDVSKVPKKIKVDQSALKVARKFLATNVVRKNLKEGYKLVGPNLKEGLTLKEWLTGNIPVVPYQADAIDVVPIQIVYSYPKEAQLRVYLLPKKGLKTRSGAFYLTLKKVGAGSQAHWLVDGWVPYGTPKLPSAGRSISG
jgi:hypothetical protein